MIAGDPRLLQLLRLASPALPVGGYSYSRGLEWAVESGTVHDEASARTWVEGTLHALTLKLDAPVLLRLHAAWRDDRPGEVERWAWFLHANRESAEVVLQERCMGEALARLLVALGEPRAAPWVEHPARSFPVAFALAAVHHGIDASSAALAFVWTSLEAQVSAAMRVIPLGQTQGQRILGHLIDGLPTAATLASIPDDALGGNAPGSALSCMLHETQYSRLFRS